MKEIVSANNFQKKLFDHLTTSFPYLLRDKAELSELLKEKSSSAQSVYENALKQGKQPYFAMEEALEELYAGFTFSPYDYLKSLLYEKYGYDDDDLSEDELIELYEVTKPVFEKYGSSFEGEYYEYKVVEELTPYLKNVTKRKTK